jgi:ubiquinone/menaquinone biosynthesis C-methylase UbiE
MARKAWDQIAPNYDQEIVSPLSQGVENPLFSTLKKIPKKSTKVVADLGCGTGNLLPTLATQFKSVHAVDFSKEMLLMAKKRAEPYKNITYHRQNMERLKLPKIQFDVAITVNSLLMPSQRGLRRAIKNIHSVLKPEGFFLGVMPAMEVFTKAC